MKARLGISAMTVAVVSQFTTTANAAEGGLSNYLAGYYGDYAVAVAPKPGLYVYGTAYSYRAGIEGPKIPESASVEGLLTVAGFQYVFDWSIQGVRMGMGGYTTHIAADLEVITPFENLRAETSDLGDSSISPLVLYWSRGPLHLNFYEAIILPTGDYHPQRLLNPSRNYTSFDTVLGVTWLDTKRGFELSIVPGLMVNTENTATNYTSGTEFHVDGMLNLYLSKTFALGVHGYYYRQLEADHGDGVRVDGLRSTSHALGPSFLFVPAELGIDGKIVGKWLHEIDGQNRFVGDILSLTLAVHF